MRNANVCCGILLSLVVLSATIHAVGQPCQCNATTCPPAGCPTTATCTVTTQQELCAALCCLENSQNHLTSSCYHNFTCTPVCSHIIINSGTILDINSPIGINCHHDGLYLEIAGTVRWVGAPDVAGEKIFNFVGCNGVTIDGVSPINGGVITSIYLASQHTGTNQSLPRAFRIVSGSNITIKNVRVNNLQSIVEVEDGSPDHLTFQGLRGENMVAYGIFLLGQDFQNVLNEIKASNVLIENCSMVKTYTGHGFRWNANAVTLKNCSGYDLHSTGAWSQGGNRASGLTTVDGFASNRRMAVGPNRAAPNDGHEFEFLRNFAAQRVRLGGSDSLDQNNTIVEMGTCGACLVNLCIGKLEIGAPESNVCANSVYFNKPLNHAYWDALSWTSPPVQFDIRPTGPLTPPDCGNTMMGAPCLPLPDPYNINSIPYGYCVADIVKTPNTNGTVNIDDLLAVINAWGDCPERPNGAATGPRPPCPADISPPVCGDSVVNIDDLLAVINHWGPCPPHQMCGLMPPTQEDGPPESAPETVNDCWNSCSAKCGDDEECWLRCFAACLESLRQRGIIE